MGHENMNKRNLEYLIFFTHYDPVNQTLALAPDADLAHFSSLCSFTEWPWCNHARRSRVTVDKENP